MRVLVCGGRDFEDFEAVDYVLEHFHTKVEPITLIIQGGATGADRLAKDWAHMNIIPCLEHPANWNKYKKAAGMIRNKEMLKWEPEMVIAFPGGPGTAGMVKIAKEAGLIVKEIRYDDGD
jgi:hypothetical protein